MGNKRTPSLEILLPVLSDEETGKWQTVFGDGEFSSDDSFTPDGSDSEYERRRQSASFSSMKTFFKRKSTPKKTKVIPITNVTQETKGKKADGRKELFITRVLERNRFRHSSKSLGGYINVPFPPGFIPSEVIVPVFTLQNDVKFDSFLKHSVAKDGTQWAVLNSSTYTVTRRPLRARGMTSNEDHSLPTETACSSSRPHPEDEYRHCKGKKHGTASRKIYGFRGKKQKEKDSGCVEHHLTNERWATHCLKLPDSEEETCSKAEKSRSSQKGITEQEEGRHERRAWETYFSKECSSHRRSAICEEIENVKQIAKVNGLRMNLRLLREDLACVKTIDQS